MKFITLKDWSWTTFKGKPGDRLDDGSLPEDVIAALLTMRAIEPYGSTVLVTADVPKAEHPRPE